MGREASPRWRIEVGGERSEETGARSHPPAPRLRRGEGDQGLGLGTVESGVR